MPHESGYYIQTVAMHRAWVSGASLQRQALSEDAERANLVPLWVSRASPAPCIVIDSAGGGTENVNTMLSHNSVASLASVRSFVFVLLNYISTLLGCGCPKYISRANRLRVGKNSPKFYVRFP